MACPPVRSTSFLTIGLSYVQVDKHGTCITIMCTDYISVDLAHHEIFHAKSVKAGIISFNCMMKNCCWCFSHIPLVVAIYTKYCTSNVKSLHMKSVQQTARQFCF